MHTSFLATGYDKHGNESPLLIAYKLEETSEGKSLVEYDFITTCNHSESIQDDIFEAISKREYPISLNGAKKVNISFSI